jgi:succinyl-CoA synthetase beta subunit
MSERLSPELLFVERTADVRDGIELVIGATRDARFGAVLLVGLGGILVETLRDTALALAPLDAAAAERLLRSLRSADVLVGVRGRPAVDVAAAARAVVALGDAMSAHPEIAELEVNPLLVTPRGALALDARVVLTPKPTE